MNSTRHPRPWSRLARLWRWLYRRETHAWNCLCRQSTDTGAAAWVRRHEWYRALRQRVEAARLTAPFR